MIITAILQTRNEESSGHLARFLKWNLPLIDNLIAYDDCSTDGTVELLKASHAEVIIGNFHAFNSELHIKDLLLRRALKLFPETTWFLWLDADELLLESRENLLRLLDRADSSGFDGIQLPLVNLWRTETKFRVDSGFNELENVRLWKNNGLLKFLPKPGLHQPMHPSGMRKIFRFSELRVLHFGFASDDYILNKFLTYQNSGQRGRNLWRLVDESSLELIGIDHYASFLGERFYTWFNKAETVAESMSSTSLIERCRFGIQENLISRNPIVTLISLIYAGVDWLEFQYGELLKLQRELGSDEVEILFVANDASVEVLNYLNDNSIPYVIAPGKASIDEWYINSVYRAYNFGVSKARGEYVLLTNSDMAYAPSFLLELLKHRHSETYLVGKLIESGRLTPAKAAIKKNLGKNIPSFKRKKFYSLAQKIYSETKSEGGLYMPLLVQRENFLRFGGYPEGNIVKDSLTNYLETGEQEIATQGENLVSGDFAFVERLQKYNWAFQTVNSAIAYHFQEGEKSEHSKFSSRSCCSGIGIEDSIPGLINRAFVKNLANTGVCHRLFISSNLTKLSNEKSVVLVTQDLDSARRLNKKEVKNLQACVTSNIDVLRYFAIDNDIHTYFIKDQLDGFESQSDQLLTDKIIRNELKLTFFPDEPESIQKKLGILLPHSLKRAIHRIRN